MSNTATIKKDILKEKQLQAEQKLRCEKARTQKWTIRADTEEVKVEIEQANFGTSQIKLGTANLKGELALAENQYYSKLLPIKQEEYTAKLTTAEAYKEKAVGKAELASAEVEALFGRSVGTPSLGSSSSNTSSKETSVTSKTKKRTKQKV